MKFEQSDALYRDPYHFLDLGLASGDNVIEFPGGSQFLTSVEDAKAVLANKEQNYAPHSDFFFTKNGLFGPRSRQVDIARAAIKLLHNHYLQHKTLLAPLVEGSLTGRTQWPDSGNWLIYQFLRSTLINQPQMKNTFKYVDLIVRRSVFSGARSQFSWWRRMVFRHKALRALKAEVQARLRHKSVHSDVLDAVIQHCNDDVPVMDMVEVFLSFLFASAGSVGFALSWSLYLQGRHPAAQVDNKEWVVLEALRLWPVAWNLTRLPLKDHTLPSGLKVSVDDTIVACPYASQRNPAQWQDASEFMPQRWCDTDLRRNLIAFGWGEHKCVAANLTLLIVTDVLQIISQYHSEYQFVETRPLAQAALAPPAFELCLHKKTEAA
ncbi:MAG: cytochrome P450 [Pseudomonadota bacterium]